MSAPVPPPTCYRHADRPANVTCAHCDRPICTDCMQHAPVGWQCPDCIRAGTKASRTIRPFANPNRTGVVGSTNPTPIVLILIAVNVVVFVASGFGSDRAISRFALQPVNIHYFHQYYRLVTAMFLHLNFLHIAFNMIALVIVGPAVEVMLGKTRFVTLYLLAGLGGSVASYLLSSASEFGAGASGAIFGVMGAYVILAQRRRQPLGQVVALIAINLVIGFTGNIDWRAHLGGLIIGSLTALLYDYAGQLRDVARGIALTVAGSAATLVGLVVLVLAVAPGHVNWG
ncbi:MAG TPA: rhomboid family intramembrane serine protease [Acidimicrobiales bacterium]